MSRGAVLLLSLWATATLATIGILQATRLSLELKWADRIREEAQARHLAFTALEAASLRLSADDPAWDALRESWGQPIQEPIPFGDSGTFHHRIADEQARIPLNQAPSTILQTLPGFTPQAAEELVKRNQEGKPLSHLGELVVLQTWGFDPEALEELEPLATVHGTGPVNLNTAEAIVLQQLGLTPEATAQIAGYRNGADQALGTQDDGVFQAKETILTDLANAGIPLSVGDQERISELIQMGLLGVGSSFFRVEMEGRTDRHGISKKIAVILDRGSGGHSPVARRWYES